MGVICRVSAEAPAVRHAVGTGARGYATPSGIRLNSPNGGFDNYTLVHVSQT